MLEHLFGSKTRYRLLRVFFHGPDKSFYVRELSRLLDTQINAIRRELELLVKLELVKETEDDNLNKEYKEYAQGSTLRRYYTLDTSSLLYPELQALLLKVELLGQRKFVEEIKERGGKLKLFLLTGQFTGVNQAPSDLLLVGDLKEKNINRIIKSYEKDFGFEVRYTLMSEKEFLDRRHVMDKFLYSMFEMNNVKVVNEYGV